MIALRARGCRALVALALALTAAGASSARAADRCRTAPGASAIDQYCEVLPTVGGGDGAGRPLADALPRSEVVRLRGGDGAALLALAAAAPRSALQSPRRPSRSPRRGSAASGADAPPPPVAPASGLGGAILAGAAAADRVLVGGVVGLLAVAAIAASGRALKRRDG